MHRASRNALLPRSAIGTVADLSSRAHAARPAPPELSNGSTALRVCASVCVHRLAAAGRERLRLAAEGKARREAHIANLQETTAEERRRIRNTPSKIHSWCVPAPGLAVHLPESASPLPCRTLDLA